MGEGEPACRPGSVTPGFLTCRYSPGVPSGLRKLVSPVLIISRARSTSDGTETEHGSVAPDDVGAAALDDLH